MNEAAQQSREPGGPEPQRYPITPDSFILQYREGFPIMPHVPPFLAQSFSVDLCFKKWMRTCSGCCGVRDARNVAGVPRASLVMFL